jgi:hypothetical protein
MPPVEGGRQGATHPYNSDAAAGIFKGGGGGGMGGRGGNILPASPDFFHRLFILLLLITPSKLSGESIE